MRDPTSANIVPFVAQQVRMTVGRALSPCSEMSDSGASVVCKPLAHPQGNCKSVLEA